MIGSENFLLIKSHEGYLSTSFLSELHSYHVPAEPVSKTVMVCVLKTGK